VAVKLHKAARLSAGRVPRLPGYLGVEGYRVGDCTHAVAGTYTTGKASVQRRRGAAQGVKDAAKGFDNTGGFWGGKIDNVNFFTDKTVSSFDGSPNSNSSGWLCAGPIFCDLREF
jgi:hypothetical protein